MSKLRYREKPAEQYVAYIPAENVAKIKEPSLVISIKGAHNDRPKIDEQKHHLFKMDFDVGDWAVDCEKNLQEQQVIDMMAFLDTHKDSGRNLYIHCTEGRIRSFTVASVLRQLGLFTGARGNPLLGPGGCLDRPTCNTMNDYFTKLEREEDAEPAQVVEHIYTQ